MMNWGKSLHRIYVKSVCIPKLFDAPDTYFQFVESSTSDGFVFFPTKFSDYRWPLSLDVPLGRILLKRTRLLIQAVAFQSGVCIIRFPRKLITVSNLTEEVSGFENPAHSGCMSFGVNALSSIILESRYWIARCKLESGLTITGKKSRVPF